VHNNTFTVPPNINKFYTAATAVTTAGFERRIYMIFQNNIFIDIDKFGTAGIFVMAFSP